MTAPTLLRLAALVALLQFAGHATLFVRSKPTHGEQEVAVVQAMQDNRFDFGGAVRSYWQMYFGYGLEAAGVCLVEAVLFWQLAGIATTASLATVRPIVLLGIVANIAHALLVMR